MSVKIARHPGFAHWVSPVSVTIRSRDGVLDVVGINRPVVSPAVKSGR